MAEALAQVQATLGDRYRVERELGRGGMATVYLAEDLKHHRQVAVKVLRPELSAAVAEQRFLQEINIAAHLSHPHILTLHDSGESDGLIYYVMPYVEGGSLRERLTATEGQLPVGEALRIVHAVADALAYSHSKGLVHRDIKPENILFQAEHPVVSDFGIARALARAGASTITQAGLSPGNSPHAAVITDVGLAVGTPAYISPEQASGGEVDHRADLYALGIVAYELLCGSAPFIRNTPQQTIAAHVSEAPRPVGELRESVPPQVASLIMRCLEKDPDKRPQSATEVMQVLETVTGLELKSSARTDARLAAKGALVRALGIYALAFVAVGATAWSAMIGLGLPDWVFPGALLVMAAGLPAIFLTAWVHYSTHATPVYLTPSAARKSEPQGLAARLLPYVSWKRTGWGTVAAIVLFVLSVSGFMTTRALGIGPAATLLSSGKIDPHERLLVTDFSVHGTDSTLGPVLTEVARVGLSDSRQFSLVPPVQVAQTLRRMERPGSMRLDLETARELALREQIKVIVDGDLKVVRSRYLLTMRLVSADSGQVLTAASEEADDVSELIRAVEKLTRRLRTNIGESFETVRGLPRLASVTTPSFDALRKYTEGVRAHILEVNSQRAVDLYREALAFDSTFAMAWRRLGAAIANAGLGRPALDSAARKAFEYRHKLTEGERLAVSAYYYWNIEADAPKAERVYEALLEYGDTTATVNLGGIYHQRRDYARAERHYHAIIAHDSSVAVAYINLAEALFNQGKTTETREILNLAARRFPQNAAVPFWSAHLLHHTGDFEESAAMWDRVRRDSRDASMRIRATYALASQALTRGQLVEFGRLRAEAISLDAARGVRAPPAADSLDLSTIDLLVRGDTARALRRMDKIFASGPPPLPEQGNERPYFFLVEFFARAGRPAQAGQLLARFEAGRASTRVMEGPYLQQAHGHVAAAAGRPTDAVDAFRRGDRGPYGLVVCKTCAYVNLASAFEAAGQSDSVVAMLGKYVNTPHWRRDLLDRVHLAGALERLGQLHDSAGNADEAAKAYSRFVDLWREADPELQPRVLAARRRLAMLRDRSE
jgi:eukaryotic-like serine/threonine-protein kinase